MDTHSNLCNINNSCLLIVDIQPTLTAAMSENDAENMLSNTSILVQAASILDIPMLMTEQYPKGLGPATESIQKLLPASAQTFDKTGFSCCAATGFNSALENKRRTQIILVGQETHVCILQTAFELRNHGSQVFVVEDAVCSRKAEHKFYAMERMRQAGVIITNYESVLFEWLRDASHPHFKSISGLIR